MARAITFARSALRSARSLAWPVLVAASIAATGGGDFPMRLAL
jgi:hypothetical protein